MTGYRLLLPDWRGAVDRVVHARVDRERLHQPVRPVRLDIKRERVEIKKEELEVERNEDRRGSGRYTACECGCARAATSRRSSAASTSGEQGLKKNAATPFLTRALLDGLGPAGRQHHDRDVLCPRVGRQPLNEFPAIAIGHRQIVTITSGCCSHAQTNPASPPTAAMALKALAAQYDEAHLPCVFMVVDHEHQRRTLEAWHAVHRELFFESSQDTALT
jgi:hypothetical protein